MRWLRKIVLTSLSGIILSSAVADATPSQLSVAEINSIAKQTTVIIAPQLTQKELEQLLENQSKSDGTRWGVGSGVIIGKQGNTYYVLTVAHNFNNSRLNQNQPYGIVTSDRQVHVLTNLNDRRGEPDCPQTYRELMRKTSASSELYRFGCFTGKEVYGIDLAVVSFQSDNNYPVASLGNAEQLNQGDLIYISGWPKLEQEPKLNSDGSIALDSQGKVICNSYAPRRQRRLAWGPLQEKLSFSENLDGYSLAYLDYTRQGMSGGPVFDNSGRVIGIHGRGSSDKPQCGQVYKGSPTDAAPLSTRERNESEESLESDNTSSIAKNPSGSGDPIAKFSAAQNVDNSLDLIQRNEIKVNLNSNPPSRELIQAGLVPIDPTQIEGSTSSGGRAEFDAQQGAFNDSSDSIENIYKLFSFKLENMLRDKPSGGCGSLLLGDRCE